jgi:biotin carboxyl carrier protein
MKLLITVQGIQYEVDVEVIDDSPKKPSIEPPSASPSMHRTLPATPAPASVPPKSLAGGDNSKNIVSPLAGNVFRVDVKPGQAVKTNDVLLVLEAMKMETPIKSPADAVIKSVLVSQGDAVAAGQKIIELE